MNDDSNEQQLILLKTSAQAMVSALLKWLQPLYNEQRHKKSLEAECWENLYTAVKTAYDENSQPHFSIPSEMELYSKYALVNTSQLNPNFLLSENLDQILSGFFQRYQFEQAKNNIFCGSHLLCFNNLCWNRMYLKEKNNGLDDNYRENYLFANLIGPGGLLPGDYSIGFTLNPPGLYPSHEHDSREVYYPFSSMNFYLDEQQKAMVIQEKFIYINRNQSHAMQADQYVLSFWARPDSADIKNQETRFVQQD